MATDKPIPLRAARRRGSSGAADGDGRTTIDLAAGKLSQNIDDCLRALGENPGDLFQRGGLLVHPVLSPVAAADGRETLSHRITLAPLAYVVELITKAARITKFDARSGQRVECNCPRFIAETLLGRGQWPLRVLVRVINAPTLRPDGSVLDRPGYDEATGLLFEPGDAKFPAISAHPSREDALRALDFLKSLFASFPLVTGSKHGADLSVALSAVLTAFVRPAIPTAPLHAFTAPVSGSGKSLLVDVVAMIATGRLAAVIAQGQLQEESEKRLAAALLAGDAIVSIDNCEWALTGGLLCQALTQSTLKVRLLGASTNVEVPGNAAIFATGNNLVLAGDLTRRALLCSLDPQHERPELRVFDTDPIAAVSGARGQYVAAALTVLRAHHVAGWRSPIAPVGSFVEWSRMVRDALLWLGEADPCETMAKARASDPKLSALGTILDEWERVIGEVRIPLSAVIENACARADSLGGSDRFIHPAFRDALLLIAADKGVVSALRLGKWAAANAGRVVGGRRLVKDGTRAGSALWRLELLESSP